MDTQRPAQHGPCPESSHGSGRCPGGPDTVKEQQMDKSISTQLKDRLSLKGAVNGVVINGVDSTPHCCPDVQPCSSQSADCVSEPVPCHSEESSGYSSSHEESRQKSAKEENPASDIRYVSYESELQMPDIMRLIQKDLSEPYSIYTYRYFIHNWPKLCFLAMCGEECVGAIVCKLDLHRKVLKRGYIAMLAVDEKHRKKRIGSNLVLMAIRAMIADDADEVVLETEITNKPALRLYENLGFVRDKRLFRYYLNGVDALRLKLWLR
ncbi:N-alpha-acetyltransferase 30-like [Neocloeon triangulifer]|uniref:N-alpha-acetyltransferase 30-like n=1 Tax=Neocloeon triangulifer TaxID=2078957 RepID=UPI00286F9B05|nr:N-alpha-acetyltransferase 30-like [Neocloeon triangulifer]